MLESGSAFSEEFRKLTPESGALIFLILISRCFLQTELLCLRVEDKFRSYAACISLHIDLSLKFFRSGCGALCCGAVRFRAAPHGTASGVNEPSVSCHRVVLAAAAVAVMPSTHTVKFWTASFCFAAYSYTRDFYLLILSQVRHVSIPQSILCACRWRNFLRKKS